MVDGNPLISLGDLTKPATVLIEKVSDAVGVLYEPRRIRKRAEAEAAADKIKAIASIELSEIEQRGLERLIFQESKKQENIENITAQAAKLLLPDAKSEKLEEDWITHFFDKCERVSDKEMQSLWSNLLAKEATDPGTYSKRTVDLIATMDKKDAELFTRLCQFSWVIGEPVALILDETHEIYINNGITFQDLKHLDSIGLISFETASGYVRQGIGKHFLISYFGIPVKVEFTNDKDNKIPLGKVLFTQAGKELLTICGASMNQEFYNYAITEMYKQDICLSSLCIKNPFTKAAA